MTSVSAIVLAAGQGGRMHSALPPAAHEICGRAMVNWVVLALAECAPAQVVAVVASDTDEVATALTTSPEVASMPLVIMEQRLSRGTGDATTVGLSGLELDFDEYAELIVIPGNVPRLTPGTMNAFFAAHRGANAVCTVMVAGGEETGIYCFRKSLLTPALRRITPNNPEAEFRLEDVLAVLRETGHVVGTYELEEAVEATSVHDYVDLAAARSALQQRINERWMRAGVEIVDPERTQIDVSVELDSTVTIHPGSALRGRSVVHRGATIGPGTTLTSCSVGSGASVVHTVAVDGTIGADSRVGPFAVLEPGAEVPEGAVHGGQ